MTFSDSSGGLASLSEKHRFSRKTLGSQIADAVRREILFGRLPPRSRLSQQELCDTFGTSRIPVRDALQELAHEGFVVIDNAGHAQVADLSRQDIEDVFHLEALVHGLAARRAAANAQTKDIEELEVLQSQMRDAEEVQDHALFSKLNWEFHRKINHLSRSTKLIALLQSVSLNVPRDYVTEMPQWVVRANDEHDQIIAALKDSDPDRVQSLIEAHVDAAGKNLIIFLEEFGTFDATTGEDEGDANKEDVA